MFTSSLKREIRHFHVVVVQKRETNVQKKCDARAKLLFCLLNFSFFLPSRYRPRRLILKSLLRHRHAQLRKQVLIIRIDSYWLVDRVKYAMDRIPYFDGPLIRECIGHKPSLCFPNQFLKTVTGVFEDVPRSLTVRGCVCFPTITLACLLQRSNVRIIQPERRWSCQPPTL